ncbi:MAG: response regulator [Acidimicrobiales bacterium]
MSVETVDGHPHLRLLEAPSTEAGRGRTRGESVAAHPAQGIRRRPVLYIGGEVDGRILFSRIARRWHSVKLLVAATGRNGLQVARDRRLGMVVMHASLPDVDAVDLLSALRSRALAPAAPIVVIAHDGTSGERARFTWAGASAYITTPLNIAEVDQAVGMLLEAAAVR